MLARVQGQVLRPVRLGRRASRRIAPIVRASSSASGRFARAIAIANDSPDGPTSGLFFTPLLARSLGLGLRRSRQAGLAQPAVGRLPRRVETTKVFKGFLNDRPDAVEDPPATRWRKW